MFCAGDEPVHVGLTYGNTGWIGWFYPLKWKLYFSVIMSLSFVLLLKVKRKRSAKQTF